MNNELESIKDCYKKMIDDVYCVDDMWDVIQDIREDWNPTAHGV